jgi:hypothetical protein
MLYVNFPEKRNHNINEKLSARKEWQYLMNWLKEHKRGKNGTIFIPHRDYISLFLEDLAGFTEMLLVCDYEVKEVYPSNSLTKDYNLPLSFEAQLKSCYSTFPLPKYVYDIQNIIKGTISIL